MFFIFIVDALPQGALARLYTLNARVQKQIFHFI